MHAEFLREIYKREHEHFGLCNFELNIHVVLTVHCIFRIALVGRISLAIIFSLGMDRLFDHLVILQIKLEAGGHYG